MSGVAKPLIDWPRNRKSPALAAHKPMMVRKVVDLPAPLRPSSIVTWHSGTRKSTPCRMW